MTGLREDHHEADGRAPPDMLGVVMMTSALAIASVTSVLKDLLDNQLVRHAVVGTVGDVTVTALPPDRVPVGGTEHNRLNLFMYRATPHTGRHRRASAGNGESPSLPALGLDLHYLLTAYGEEDLHAEILLGYAVQLLHRTPVLGREVIRDALASISTNGSGHVYSPARAALTSSTLAEQVEEITICPEFISMEDTTKIWSALQAHYRPSVAYEVSAVVIEATR